METKEIPNKKSKLTLYIFIALLLGILVGFLLNAYYVGDDNSKIANADTQLKDISKQLKVYETPKDTSAYQKLVTQKKDYESLKKAMEKEILSGINYKSSIGVIGSFNDSIKHFDLQMDLLIDTNNANYKSLAKHKLLLASKKTEVQKARDKKLDFFSILSEIFLKLIKMIVAPLVFTTLVVGVAKLGTGKSVGRIGGRTLLWFLGASLVSLLLGMLLVNLFNPGASMGLALPDANTATGIDKNALNTKDFISNIFPTSIFDALSRNVILQIVVFSMFFGVACGAMGDYAKPIVNVLDKLSQIILKITGYVMKVAPIAVFGAMATVIAKQGLGILKNYSIFIGEFYFSLIILWLVIIFAGYLFLKKRVFNLVKRIKDPTIIAFSTSSSEAAFPKTMDELEKFGCPNKIASFVLPMGYSFNLDGSMMYMTFASIFIAQSYNIHLGIGQQISMLLVLLLTSKGIAAVPRASLVVIAGALATFNIPEAGLALLLGIDPILDMGRSATNVVGNSVATAVISKMEGELENKE